VCKLVIIIIDLPDSFHLLSVLFFINIVRFSFWKGVREGHRDKGESTTRTIDGSF
jgi:hypothetical protein